MAVAPVRSRPNLPNLIHPPSISASRRHRSCRGRVVPRAFAPWRPPDGSNPLEGFFASDAPVGGLGALTGLWYLDVFALMNVVLLMALIAWTFAMRDETEDDDGMGTGDDDGR